jgi:IMP dehydrogenase
MHQALTYDDIQLIPNLSAVKTRQDINLSVPVTRNWSIDIPIVGSCMDTVTEYEMAATLMELGGVGCIHRFMSIEDQVAQVRKLDAFRNSDPSLMHLPIMAAIGVTGDYLDRAVELEAVGCNILVVDVAHGHHENMQKALKELKANLEENLTDVVAGNIATMEAAEDLISWGADGLRVGIGGGSLCTTRVKTGFGVPNVTSIEAVFEISDSAGIPIMADGGIKSSGDIAKALAVGADCVMVGSLLAGTKESPGAILETPAGLYKRYRGSASLETKVTHGQKTRNVEGESTTIPFKGGVKFILNGLTDGIRSAFSYAGANNATDYYVNTDYNVVTNAGLAEGKPHLIK